MLAVMDEKSTWFHSDKCAMFHWGFALVPPANKATLVTDVPRLCCVFDEGEKWTGIREEEAQYTKQDREHRSQYNNRLGQPKS